MFIDALDRVSNSQVVTGAGTTVSTDKIDLGASSPRHQLGHGNQLGFAIAVITAADAANGDETYEFKIISDEDAALGSPTIHAEYPIARGLLTLGSLHWLPLPSTHVLYERYLGLQHVLGGTTPSITITAWLTARDLFAKLGPTYPKNYAV